MQGGDLTPLFQIEEGSTTQTPGPEHFPLQVGGAESAIDVPGLRSAGPVALLALAEGELFLQPHGDDPAGILCNGSRVSTSQWLRDGDVLRVADTRIHCKIDTDVIRLSVEQLDSENRTEPPVVVPVEVPEDPGPGVTSTVEPIRFEPAAPASKHGGLLTGRRIRPATLLLGSVLAALGLLGWFLFTAQSIAIEFEPEPDSFGIEGSWWNPSLDGRYLLQPGEYRVTARLEGYRPLDEPLVVVENSGQSFRFELRRLPGYLKIELPPVRGFEIFLDGQPAGEPPLGPFELEPGLHSVTVRSERFLEFHTEVEVEGRERTTSIKPALKPLWATIRLDSQPAGAEVMIDGTSIGRTPLETEVLAGGHDLELRLPGYKRHLSQLRVAANDSVELPAVRLQPLGGRLSVATVPSGASLSVDGQFHGETPADLELSPGTPHELSLSMEGFETVRRSLSLESGEAESLQIDLIELLGEVEISAAPADAELLVNGQLLGRASQTLRLQAVPQEIEVRKEGFVSFHRTLTPTPQFPQHLEVELKTAEQIELESISQVISSPQGQELRLIEPGRLQMGAPRREPGRRANEAQRVVQLTRRFYFSVHEVTNREFKEFRSSHKSGKVAAYTLELDKNPVVNVTWEDAARYCNWLSRKASLPPAYLEQAGVVVGTFPLSTGFRLPTEAEWAWVARYAGRQASLKYPWGNDLPVPPHAGNFGDTSARAILGGSLQAYSDDHPATAPVGSYDANALGIFDLGGNVAEWMHDGYSIGSSGGGVPEIDPAGPQESELHVIRGAGWMDGNVTELRLSYREYGGDARADVGFRLARYLDPAVSHQGEQP